MNKLTMFLCFISILLFSSCEKEEEIPTENDPPPIADFTKSPTIVIADKTFVQFENTSAGKIDSYSWDFEGGLGSSNERNPSYIFDYEGLREVKLKVGGPGGSEVKSSSAVVFAFDPNCKNYSGGSTHSTDKINNLRSNNLVKGGILKVKNNYNVTVDVLLYSPADWLNGIYESMYYYTLNSGVEVLFYVNGNPFQYSNEWGIRVQGTNGVISCIRTLGAVSDFNGSQYQILASKILDGI